MPELPSSPSTPTDQFGNVGATQIKSKSEPSPSRPRVFGMFAPRSSDGASSIFTVNNMPSFEDFERKRDDGVFAIDLIPDCRVFVYGGEITKDVIDVTVSNSVDGGMTCDINIANPRGKFEISKQDLMRNWREDKDILSMYDYDWLKRPNPMGFDPLKLVSGVLGEGVTQQVTELTRGFQEIFGTTPTWPANANITRMVFENKFYSGLDKRVGDIVFDYRDPVYVFMKGRFSPFWYFAFSGMVNGFSDSDTFGSNQVINLKCADLLWLLSKKKFAKRAAILSAGNLENSVLSNDVSDRVFDLYNDFTGSGFANQLIKAVVFSESRENTDRVANCFPLTVTAIGGSGPDIGRIKNYEGSFKNFYDNIENLGAFKSKEGFMFTYDRPNGNISSTKYKFPISSYSFVNGSLGNSPNGGVFSPWIISYFQYNEITPEKMNGVALKNAYNGTVRFWEADHDIEENSTSDGVYKWKDTNFFGVAGIHPALTWEFINSFNILPTIWQKIYTRGTRTIDSCILSPHDKIRETIVGCGTERDQNGSPGNNLNYFRPRFFLTLPKKYVESAVGASGFGEFSLFNEDATNALDVLKNIAQKMEYNLYTSPMGDVFMEPSLHDTHPLEYWENIDIGRNILSKDDGPLGQQGLPIQFRQLLHDNARGAVCRRTDSAYFYNTDANHPFFIMEKDRIRLTHTLKPEYIKTSTIVIGAVISEKMGGATQALLNDALHDPNFFRNMSTLNFSSGGATAQPTSPFTAGVYIADGFTNIVRTEGSTIPGLSPAARRERIMAEIVDLRRDLRNSIMNKLLQSDRTISIYALIQKSVDAVRFFYNDNSNLNFNPESRTNTDTNTRQQITIPLWPEGLPVLSELRTYISNQDHNVFFFNDKVTDSEITLIEYTLLRHLARRILVDIMRESRSTSTPQSVTRWNQTQTASKRVDDYVVAGTNLRITDSSFETMNGLNEIASIISTNRDYIDPLYNLYKPYAIKNDSQIHDLAARIDTVYASLSSRTILDPLRKPKTIADLKVWATEGFYSPREDLMRRYGYNASPPHVNFYIHNGKEATEYAKIYFQQLYGRANTYTVSILGRPEIFLNRPYYVERKDAIGLLDSYSMSFSLGSSFVMDTNINYIRKNALTYSYTLQDLDEIIGVWAKEGPGTESGIISGGENTNRFFKEQALQYYDDVYGPGLRKLLTNTVGGAIASVAGQSIADRVSGLWNAGLPRGGLYTAHDWIGHVDYEEDTYGGCTGLTRFTWACRNFESNETQIIFGICQRIQENLTRLKTLETSVDQIDERVRIKRDYISNLEQKLNEQQPTAQATAISSLRREISVARSEISALNAEKSSTLETHRSLATIIYGQGYYVDTNSRPITSYENGSRVPAVSVINTQLDQQSLYYKLAETFRDARINSTNQGVQNVRYTYLDDRSDEFSQSNPNVAQTVTNFGVSIPIYVKNIANCVEPTRNRPTSLQCFIKFPPDRPWSYPKVSRNREESINNMSNEYLGLSSNVPTYMGSVDNADGTTSPQQISAHATTNIAELNRIIEVVKDPMCEGISFIGHNASNGVATNSTNLAHRRAQMVKNQISIMLREMGLTNLIQKLGSVTDHGSSRPLPIVGRNLSRYLSDRTNWEFDRRVEIGIRWARPS